MRHPEQAIIKGLRDGKSLSLSELVEMVDGDGEPETLSAVLARMLAAGLVESCWQLTRPLRKEVDTCPRCGAPLKTITELADIAQKAADAHRAMRLVLPQDLTAGVHALAAALPCHAGTCRPAGDR